MKVDWQQLSPREREVYVRHFSVKQKTGGAPVLDGLPVSYLKATQERNGRAPHSEMILSRK